MLFYRSDIGLLLFQCELHRSLPSSRPSTANQRSPAAAALSRLMDDWDVIKKAREVIERELKEADLNMGKTNILMENLTGVI